MVGEKLVDLWGMILKDGRFQKMELRLERVWFFLVWSASSTTSEMSFLFMVVFWIVEDGLGMVKRSCCMGSWGECGSEWVCESSSTKWLVAHVKSLD
jgi:hypothetical protein